MTISDFFEKNKKLNFKEIFAGFSGGADSTALLLLLDAESRKRNFKLIAVHFNHGLRGKESDSDANWCRKFCEIRKIKHIRFMLDVQCSSLPGESTESTARRLRLEKWKVLAGKPGAFIALGHNANDRIENVLLRLFRGSNSSGLSSMRKSQKIENLTFIRPLLKFKRKEIEAFLKTQDIQDWRTDKTNNESIYRRNFLRNNILPMLSDKFPSVDDAILKSFHALETDADFIETEALLRTTEIIDRHIVPLSFFTNMHPALTIRIIRYWISKRTGADFIPDGEFLTRFCDSLKKFPLPSSSPKNKILIPVSNITFLKLMNDGISMIIQEKPPREENFPMEWNWKRKRTLAFGEIIIQVKMATGRNIPKDRTELNASFDTEQMPADLLVRHFEKDDTMIPFGETAPIRIKKLFESRKIQTEKRASIPLLCTLDNEIIWIPGVRRANFANITPDTKRTVVFKLNV